MPTEPNVRESPAIGGALTPVQLAPVAQLLSPALPVQVSVPLAAKAEGQGIARLAIIAMRATAARMRFRGFIKLISVEGMLT